MFKYITQSVGTLGPTRFKEFIFNTLGTVGALLLGVNFDENKTFESLPEETTWEVQGVDTWEDIFS